MLKIFLEEGDIADITKDSVSIFDKNGTKVKRAIKISKLKKGQTSKGDSIFLNMVFAS
jgi:glucosamine--fructose-6-phosphate aminotransferase (isomerizing)